jgi:hypothetical protein
LLHIITTTLVTIIIVLVLITIVVVRVLSLVFPCVLLTDRIVG